MGGVVAVYFEPAAAIVVLVLLGQVLELRARSRTGAAIRTLLGLAPKTAHRIDPDETERDVPLGDIRVGDRMRVRPGERVPVDGVVSSDWCDKRGRIDGDRGTDPCRKSGRCSGDRRNREWYWSVRDARDFASAPTRCSPRSFAW